MQRKGFTLVELLIVIAILAILASMVLFALAGAEGTAKEMRTQTTINKLNQIVARKWDSFQTRRMQVNTLQIAIARGWLPAGSHQSQVRPAAAAQIRLDALRETMRMELPDRLTDILDDPVVLNAITSPALAYRRTLAGVNETDEYQGSECLYLFVSLGTDDPEVMEQFAASEIGDKDEDGLKEFWDAWEKPISFLRWAPGFESTLQDVSAPIDQHDTFDPLRVYYPTNTSDPWYLPPPSGSAIPAGKHPQLTPLIYSAGPDGEYDIFTDSSSSPLHYRTTSPPNNPYHLMGADRIGMPYDLDSDGSVDATDNISNHD